MCRIPELPPQKKTRGLHMLILSSFLTGHSIFDDCGMRFKFWVCLWIKKKLPEQEWEK
ncbi:hypothetical protein LguiB_018322 [Lonicera macranthoides]